MSATGASWCLKNNPQCADKCINAKGINGCLCNVGLSKEALLFHLLRALLNGPLSP